jgi:hypothetical protein
MYLHLGKKLACAATVGAVLLGTSAVRAGTVNGSVEVTPEAGRYLALDMTISDTTTRFTLTGPDFSWFAFGFDTDTMQGYSLIVEGTDATRTAVEQNLAGIGNPGLPQGTQNISLVDVTHDAANDLTTVVIERANNTGDATDPVFSPSMTTLDVIWAYSSFSSPAAPAPELSFHGTGGRGTTVITFVPEPTGGSLAAIAGTIALSRWRRRQRL